MTEPRELTYLVPADVRAEVNTAVAVLQIQGSAVTEALQRLDQATTMAWKAVNMLGETDEEWEVVKREVGIDRGWDAAYQLLSAFNLPGQRPSAVVRPKARRRSFWRKGCVMGCGRPRSLSRPGASAVWSCVTPARLVTFLPRSMSGLHPHRASAGTAHRPEGRAPASMAQVTTPGPTPRGRSAFRWRCCPRYASQGGGPMPRPLRRQDG